MAAVRRGGCCCCAKLEVRGGRRARRLRIMACDTSAAERVSSRKSSSDRPRRTIFLAAQGDRIGERRALCARARRSKKTMNMQADVRVLVLREDDCAKREVDFQITE